MSDVEHGLPYLGHGVGLRLEHYALALEQGLDVDWVEAISENFMGPGGRPIAVLEHLAEHMPVVLHGTSLGIGSAELSETYLDELVRLVERVGPAWISDHLCWGSMGGHFAHDLLPFPFTQESLDHLVEATDRVQQRLGRRMVLENVSSYVTFRASTMTEWDFLAELCERADCLLLLDLNNVIVSAHNHGFEPWAFVEALPADRIVQFHLANHTDRGHYKFDSHKGPVPPEVWALYDKTLQHLGPVSTLIEWDEDVPEWSELRAQQREAKRRAIAILGERADVAR